MDYEKIPADDLNLSADVPASDVQEANVQAISADAMPTATGNIVTLPAGVSLDDITVSGRDLVIEMPDGTTMVIPDGAIFIPQFVIDGVAVPPINLAALLIGNEPEPAAGATQSSGGNFADPVDPIQDAFAIGDLLPPTELAFPIYEEREIIPNLVNREPSITIITPDNPAGAINASDSVDEAGLPARGDEPAGSNAAASTETTSGSIVYSAPDGLGSVTINGTAITAVGQTITGAHGTLTIIAIADGQISYNYTLTDNSSGNNTSDDFTIVVTDVDGDTATGTLDIAIVDDVPDAVNDSDSVAAGTYTSATGNVLTDAEGDGGRDTQGADGAVVTAITGTAAGAIGGTTQGQYGVLTLNADGSYSYVRNPGTPGGVTDSFTYTITDGDGDTDTATLTISIGDSGTSLDLPTDGEAGTSVDEAGLPDGSAGTTDVETTAGTFTYTAPDGPATVTIGGVAVAAVGQTFTGAHGTLTITAISNGSVSYSYTLTENTSGDATSDDFAIIVTDRDGDASSGTLSVAIVDDVPTAADDADTIAAGRYGPATGNVITDAETDGGKDTQGADGAVVSAITGTEAGTVGGTTQGQYGVLTLNADGSYSYVRNPGTPGGVADSFTYTITDGDGDTDTATLVITIADSPATVISVPTAGGGTIVDEAGLPERGEEPEGSDEPSDVETTDGTITFSSPDGPPTVTINGVVVTGPGQTITTPTGTLTITGYDPVAGTIDYSFTLTDNTNGDTTTETLTVVVTDVDGDSDSAEIIINIVDDVPDAINDSATQSGENQPVTVNVLGNDVEGADGVSPGTVAVVADTLTGTGTLVVNPDGSITYTPGPGETGTVTFDYAITDGDGDSDTATVTITLLADSTPGISLSGDTNVEEAGLPARGEEPAGSAASTNGEIAVGAIMATTGNDSIATLVIGGVNVTNGGTVTGEHGTLVVTRDGSTYNYVYTLTDNSLGDATSDDFTVVLTDSDGDMAGDTLSIAIVDDVPTAVDDSDSLASGTYGPAVGNVITDAEADGGKDTQGADGIVVSAVTGTEAGTIGGTTQGQYGVLTLNADGSYSYVRNPGSLGGVTDSFTYTVTDGDGDTDTATLTITIGDSGTSLDLPTEGEAGTSVDEAGLPDGSASTTDVETTAGAFTYTAPDGPATVTIGGVAVTAVGQTFTGAHGTLTITAIANGSISYSYTLTENTLGDDTSDDFAVVVTDRDGDASSGTLSIAIVDDVPTAKPDTDGVTEDGPLVADGNVIVGGEGSDANTTDGVIDVQGADGATVTEVAFGATAGVVDGDTAGEYGTLILGADGHYTYTLNNNDPRVQGLDSTQSLTEVFTYTIKDADGDESETTLTITIQGDDDPITISGLDGDAPDLVVDEDNLSDGSSPDAPALTQSGTFTVNGLDGINSITIEGTEAFVGQTFTTAHGIFTITSLSAPANGTSTSIVVGYQYVLTDNLDHADAAGENSFFESFEVVATDGDSAPATAIIDVEIIDDVPTAKPDTDGVTEDGPLVADGNVIVGGEGSDANTTDGVIDVQGADGATVTEVAFGATAGVVDGDTVGEYGTLILGADGHYSYTLNNNDLRAQGLDGSQSLTEVFTYTIKDADGDESETTLTITISGADDDVTITGLNADGAELIVDEDDLSDGSSPSAPALTQNGTFTVNGLDGISSITIEGTEAHAGQTFTTTYGTFTITSLSAPANGASTSIVVGYQYVLTNDRDHDTALGENSFIESFDVVATDGRGAPATATIDVEIIDDVPAADPDMNTVDEGDTLTVDEAGGVLANDVEGADGAVVIGVRTGTDTSTEADTNVDTEITGDYGKLTLHADGSYTYVSNANVVPPGGATDYFVYSIKDADGDISTTTLQIKLNDAGLAATDDNNIVNEAALAIGSNPDSPAETTVGGNVADNVTGGTGPYTYALVSSATGTHGTITFNTDGTYSYTLTSPVDGPTANNGTNIFDNVETFTYLVTDANGNTFEADITIDVIDDVPTARDETAISLAEDAAAVGGNVLTGPIPGSGDTQGADGATLTKVTIAGVDVIVAATGTTTYSNANGTYTFTAAGVWTFDPVARINNTTSVDASFTYEITDGDGDKDTAIQPISITDGADPTVSAPIKLLVDDQNLSDGSTPGNADFDSGTLTFTPGSDAIASIVFGTDLSTLGGGLTWVRVSATQIVGSDGATPIVQLDLSVTGNAATVTATLLNNYDSHPTINVDDLVALGTVAVVATDTDGDHVDGIVSVSVSDDLPTITVVDAPAGAIVVDETDLNINASANFSGLFTPDVNADGPGTVTYSLVVAAGASGLIDVATGQAVMLSMNGAGQIEGKTETDGDLVFTITVDASGNVTLDQLRAVDHPIDTDHNDAVGFIGSDLIGLEARITDADGDWDDAVADLTGAFTFLDDGPSITANLVDSTLVLTTQDADTIVGPDIATSAANFSGAFSVATSSYGADGAGSIAWAYSLEILNATSGLTSHGVAIALTMNGTTVEGRAGGTLIFSIGVDATGGTVTLKQYGPIDHAVEATTGPIFDDQLATLANNIVQLVGEVTIKDRDNDSDSDKLTLDLGGNISFADHGPAVSLKAGATATLLVDDSDFATNASANLSGLFNAVNYGADGAGSVGYKLAITTTASGLVDTLTGQAVVLSVNGSGVVEGRTATGGALVFTVSVDASGNVTLDQSRAVVHPTNPDSNETISLADGIITLEQIATDYDGDTDSAVANIGGMLQFADDGPTVGPNAAVQLDDDALPGGNPGGTGDVDPNTANLTGTLTHDFNNDGGSLAFLTTGAPAGFTYILSGTSLLIKQGTVTVITVTLNTATGLYGVTQNAPIVHPLGGQENDVSFTLTYRVTDGDNDWVDGNITINVDDDTPIANDDAAITVAEDGANIGGNVLTNDFPGADGATLTSVTIGGTTTAIAASGTTTVTTTTGVYTFTATGVWTFNPNTNLNNASPLDASFTYEITDGDGDKDGAVQTISVSDGALPTTTKNATIIVDEQGLGTANATGTVGDASEADDDTVTFSGGSDQITSVVFGGTGSITLTGYSGTPITWSAGGGTTITGTINGIVAITLTLTGITTGATAGATVTATLADNFAHLSGSGENSIAISGVTVVATDTDGDPTSATVGITIIDDVPTVTVTANTGAKCALDETASGSTASTMGVTNIGDDPHVAGSGWISRAVGTAAAVTVGGVYGADGPAATNPLTYSLSVTNTVSGLFTTEGTAIVLVKEGNNIVGRVGSSAGVAAFAISINSATGIVTVEQYLSLRHPVTTNPDDTIFLAAGSLGVVVTRTDGDNDQTVSSATDISGQISFDDDGPTGPVAPASVSLVNVAGTSATSWLDTDHNIANNMGADGGVVRFPGSLNGTTSTLTSNLVPITYTVSADGLTLTGSAGGSTVFTITLNQAASTYTVNMVGKVDSITTIDFNDGGYRFEGSNNAWAGFVPTGEPTAGTNNDSRDILMTPEINNAHDGTINSSSVAGGVSDQGAVGTGEVFRVDFVIDLRGDSGGSGGYDESANRDHVFDKHYTAYQASAVFTATPGSVVKISAYDDPDGNNIVGDGVIDAITSVSISWNGVSAIFTSTTAQAVSVGGQDFTVTFNADGSVNVGGVVGTDGKHAVGTQIAVTTANGYNSLEYAYVSGGSFKIGDFGVATSSTNPVNFTVPVLVVDGDGDSTATSNLAITLTAPPTTTTTSATTSARTMAANDTGNSGVAAAIAASGLMAMDMVTNNETAPLVADNSNDSDDGASSATIASNMVVAKEYVSDEPVLDLLQDDQATSIDEMPQTGDAHYQTQVVDVRLADVDDVAANTAQTEAPSEPDMAAFAAHDFGAADGGAMMEMLLQMQQAGPSLGAAQSADPNAVAAAIADAFETHPGSAIDTVIDHLAGSDGAASLLTEAGAPDAVLNAFFQSMVGADHSAMLAVHLPLTPEETELAVAAN